MKGSTIRQILCLSSVALLLQTTAVGSALAKSSQDRDIELLKERLDILEYKHREDMKNRAIDPVLALPQANYRQKYDTAPTYDQDLAMLKIRKKYERELKKRKITPSAYPRIELGGSVMGLGSLRKSPKVAPTNGKMQNDMTLSGANFNITSEIADFLLGAIRLSYNPNGPERIDTNTIMSRLANSTIFLNTGFLTLGDLHRSPFYGSFGQMFVPFGAYNSGLTTAPLTARLGRTKERPILVGYQGNGALSGLNASLFVFKGDAYVNNNAGVIDNGGANIAYKINHAFFNLQAGASYLANIADSGGMQNSGSSTIVSDAGDFVDNSFLEDDEEEGNPSVPAFRGFGANGKLAHRVPAFNARAKLNLHKLPLSFYGEMVQSIRSFADENLTFNGHGAKPSAWNAEAAIHFSLFDYPSSFSVGYGRSKQSLALNMPLYSTGAAIRTNLKRALSCAVGYQYDSAYPIGSYATGQTLPVNTNKYVGTSTHTVVIQVGGRF
ncbi:MAG: LbtU family siderophore porin [Legionella sp.]